MPRIETSLPEPVDPAGKARPAGPRRSPVRRERSPSERKRRDRSGPEEPEAPRSEDQDGPDSSPEGPAPGRYVDLRV